MKEDSKVTADDATEMVVRYVFPAGLPTVVPGPEITLTLTEAGARAMCSHVRWLLHTGLGQLHEAPEGVEAGPALHSIDSDRRHALTPPATYRQ